MYLSKLIRAVCLMSAVLCFNAAGEAPGNQVDEFGYLDVGALDSAFARELGRRYDAGSLLAIKELKDSLAKATTYPVDLDAAGKGAPR